MSPDLRLLLWTLVLTFIEVVVAVLFANAQVGLGMLAGNREGLPPLAGFAGRAQRAHRNMLESLPIFIGLVLIAQIAAKTNSATLTGCELFFWGRLAHWIIYVIGIPWLRTIAWIVSVIGLIVIFAQLV
ncbi:MAG: MAPEG family protein [Stellaceae bacterium]